MDTLEQLRPAAEPTTRPRRWRTITRYLRDPDTWRLAVIGAALLAAAVLTGWALWLLVTGVRDLATASCAACHQQGGCAHVAGGSIPGTAT